MKFEEKARLKIFPKGTYLTQQGLPLTLLIKIIKGRCKTLITSEEGNTLLLAYYDGEGFIGDIEFFSGDKEASTTIVAVEDVEALVFDLEKAQKIFKDDVQFLNDLGKQMAIKFLSANKQSSTNILDSVEERLLNYIKLNFQNSPISEKLSDIAMYLGTSYRHLLRCVVQLQDKGLLIKDENGYHLLN